MHKQSTLEFYKKCYEVYSKYHADMKRKDALILAAEEMHISTRTIEEAITAYKRGLIQ